MSEIGSLWVTLEAHSATFLSDMEIAEKKFEKTREAAEQIGDSVRNVGLVMGAFGTSIVAAMGMAVVSLAKTADGFDEMSARTGVSVKALQELTYASKLSGGSAESTEGAFKKMAMTITQAGDGMTTAKGSLKNLNLTFKDFIGLSPEEQFNKLSGAISDIKDPSMRAAAAVDIFGRSGTSLLPMLSNGRAGLDAMRNEANVFGTVLTGSAAVAAAQLGDDIDRLTMGVRGLWDQIAIALLPIISSFVASAKNIIAETRNWIAEHQSLFAVLVRVTGAVALAVAAFGSVLVVIGSLIAAAPLLGIAITIATGPIGIIIGAIGALIAAGYLLIAHWDFVKYATMQSWEFIKMAVLLSIQMMLQGMTNYLSWIPGFGNKLKAAMASINSSLLTSTKQYETNKSNYEAQQAAKNLAKLKVDNAKTLAEVNTHNAKQKLSHEQMIQSLSASWAQFMQDYKMKTMNWYAELERLAGSFEAALGAGFAQLFMDLGKGWSSFSEAMATLTTALKNAIIQQLADMAAKWVMQHLIMSAASKAWAILEVLYNSVVAAAKTIAGWSSIPFVGWALGLAAAAVVVAAMMGMIKFEDGGIVGGSSYSGDHIMAGVNSGEVIMNERQQARTLMAIANGSGQGGGNSSVNTGDIIIQGDVDGQNIDRIARQLREAVKSGAIEALSLAKTMTRQGNYRTSEAI